MIGWMLHVLLSMPHVHMLLLKGNNNHKTSCVVYENRIQTINSGLKFIHSELLPFLLLLLCRFVLFNSSFCCVR
jgi:hypothetical protein